MNILYLSTAIVEVDNFLPIYVELKKKTKQQDICVLAFHSEILNTSLIRNHVKKNNIINSINFFNINPIINTMLHQLSILSSILHRVNMRYPIYLFSKLSGLSIFLLKYLLNKYCHRVKENPPLKYDWVILSEGIYQSILDFDKLQDPKKILHFPFQSIINNNKIKKVVFPETFNQWNEVVEFNNVSSTMIDQSTFFLSRGQQKKRWARIPKRKYVDIGVPRYSKYWVKILNNVNPSIKFDTDGFLRILYLPNKKSPVFPKVEKWIEKMNREVFGLLETYPDIYLIVKPHPRTWSDYLNVKRFTRYIERVRSFNRNTDTASLASACDIIITHGTSFVGHALWIEKPVVLLDEWANAYNKSFIYKNFCYSLNELPLLFDSIHCKKSINKKHSQKDLEEFFQCGKSDVEYKKCLSSQLDFIFH